MAATRAAVELNCRVSGFWQMECQGTLQCAYSWGALWSESDPLLFYALGIPSPRRNIPASTSRRLTHSARTRS